MKTDWNTAYDQAKEFMARVTYKPNTRFTVGAWCQENGPPIGITLNMFMTVPDVDNPETTTELHCSQGFLLGSMEHAGINIVQYVLNRVIETMENHERDEWLKIDGKHVRDPHPKKETHGD